MSREKNTPSTSVERLYDEIRQIVEGARNQVYRTANQEMVKAYWHTGRLIVEEEQKGKERAAYGKELIKELSGKLTSEYGKGFNTSNLWYMRQFYNTFEKLHAVRGELSWTHYRLLLKVEKEEYREFYMQEAIEGNWSTRTLERQINSLYYERMLLSRKEGRSLVKQEAESKKEPMQAKDIIT